MKLTKCLAKFESLLNLAMSKVEFLSSCLADMLTYVIMLLFNQGTRFSEIKARKLSHDTPVHSYPPKTDNISEGACDVILQEAREILELEKQRALRSDDKSRVLLTIATMLIAGCLVIFPHTESTFLTGAALTLAVLSIFILIQLHGVRNIQPPDLTELTDDWNDASKSMSRNAALKLRAIHQYVDRANTLNPQNSYRVSVAVTASRLLTIAALLFVPAVLQVSSRESSEKRLIKALLNDKTFRETLKGPKEDQGRLGYHEAQELHGLQGLRNPHNAPSKVFPWLNEINTFSSDTLTAFPKAGKPFKKRD